MRAKKNSKLNLLLSNWPLHTVATISWLQKMGFRYENLAGYLKSGWVTRVSSGVYQRCNDTVDWEGVLYGLQQQYPEHFHVGGKTALEMSGAAHFVPFGESKLYLFSTVKKILPPWFRKQMKTLNKPYSYLQYNFIPTETGLTTRNCGEFNLVISSRERAALEVVEQLGKAHNFEECRLLLENLSTLRPSLVQTLLTECTSVKTKRVFLFLCKRLGHRWFNDLNLTYINLGSGPRDVTPGGVFDSEFQITYPKGLFENDKLEI